jgi:hypothetical protein
MRTRRRRCLCCGRLFGADPRNRYHQEFCSNVHCQKASQSLSLQRWKAKAENRGYWTGPEQVERVRSWRKAHPGYWRRGDGHGTRKAKAAAPLHAATAAQAVGTLQKDIMPKDPLVLGIISLLAGSTLQKDIVAECVDLIALGNQIVGQPS